MFNMSEQEDEETVDMPSRLDERSHSRVFHLLM
jgi:hypothetical protein